MTHEQNEREWHRPENWRGLRWLGIYRAPADPRLWVPKRWPMLGWTLNFAHPRARLTFFAVTASIAVLGAVLGHRFGR